MFNCLQRGHQQALETYSQFLAYSVFSGVRFPVFTSIMGLFWMFSRLKWAEGYASGDPQSRYAHWAGAGIWYTIIGLTCGCVGTALGMVGIV